MAASDYGSRPWLKFHPADFYSSRAVRGLTREQQLRYLGAIFDSWMTPEPGVHTEDGWRDLLGYSSDEWGSVHEAFARCFDTSSQPDKWLQSRLVEEHDTATSRSDSARDKANEMHRLRRAQQQRSSGKP